ncbi:hypothetical protein OS187_02325 [Xanthomonadaceae bacterium JHOS43]|nr:hypothetical protein [Xanthomonadaceae bacterium JHOS43]
MSRPASVFFTGMDSADAEQLIALFHEINRRIGQRWTLAADADSAGTLVIDVDTLYGHMTWLRAQTSEQTVVALTSGASAEADKVLHRPVTPDAMRRLLTELAGTAASPEVATPAPPKPSPEPPLSTSPLPPVSKARPSVMAAPAPAPEKSALSVPEPPVSVPPPATPPPAPPSPVARKLIDLILAGDIPAGPHKLELHGQPPLVLDMAQKAFLCGNSIKAFMAYTQMPLAGHAFHPVSSSEFAALQQSIGGNQPIGRLVWLAALGGSAGEIPGGEPDARYRLTRWPQIEREFPKHFRIATTMMKGFQTAADLAEQSGATLAEVNDFIAASLVSGYAEAESTSMPEMPATAQKSLLDRLRGGR